MNAKNGRVKPSTVNHTDSFQTVHSVHTLNHTDSLAAALALGTLLDSSSAAHGRIGWLPPESQSEVHDGGVSECVRDAIYVVKCPVVFAVS